MATVEDRTPEFYLKDPKLWELWYIPYYGSCRIHIINRRAILGGLGYEGSWVLASCLRFIRSRIGMPNSRFRALVAFLEGQDFGLGGFGILGVGWPSNIVVDKILLGQNGLGFRL